MSDVKLVLDAKAELGEGALWDEQKQHLYWLDILNGEIHRYTPANKTDEVFSVGQHTSAIVLSDSGDVIVATKNGFARFDLETETLKFIVDPEKDKGNNRFNDGKADPAGRFWAGTMSYDVEAYAGALYCLETDGTVSTKEEDVTISNGIVWTADYQTMYYVDSAPNTITAFEYDKATGSISKGRIVVKVPDDMGSPDGMAIDTQGQLWVAHWGYGAVVCWCPKTGEKISEIAVPASQVTACAFGGEDFKTLYITTARTGLSDERLEEEPLAGGLFCVQTEVTGLATYRYGG